MKNKTIIPITFALDDNFIPFLATSIDSIIKHASTDYEYKFYVFHNGLSKKNIEKFSSYSSFGFTVDFINVNDKINEVNHKICVRDNYSEAIYYRFFIPEILRQYDKVIYIDCDTILVDDIANLFNTDLGDNLLGAVVDEAVAGVQIFREYVLKYLSVPQPKYFNSGVLLFNAKKCREVDLEGMFIKMLNKVVFKVAPDQDFLNVICKDKVKYLDLSWNKLATPSSFDEKNLKLIHYNLNFKPWHFDGITYENYFWDIARNSKFYDEILSIKNNYGEKEKAISNKNFEKLIILCEECIKNSDNSPVKKEDFFDGIK